MAYSSNQDSPVNIEPQPISRQASAEKIQSTAFRQKVNCVDVFIEAQSTLPRSHLVVFALPFKNVFTKHEILRLTTAVIKFAKFMGPGAIISVAYIDPDNYQTAISSGELHYKLLFVILVSNVIAIYLQVRL
jgi:metal iron transporter